MEILVVTNIYPPEVLGGYEILCQQVANGLRARGHNVTVLTTGSPRFHDVDGIPVHRILELFLPFDVPPKGRNRTRRLLADITNHRLTGTFLKDRHFDCAVVFSQLRLTPGAVRAIQERGIPTLFSMNDYHAESMLPAQAGRGLKTRVASFLDRGPLRRIHLDSIRMDNVTCISEAVRNGLADRGIRFEKCNILYQGIPLADFPLKDNPGRIAGNSPVKLLYAGQLHEYKGVHTVLEAAGILAPELPVRVTLAGDGTDRYKRTLARIAAEAGLEVNFIGRVDRKRLAEEYRSHDIFIFPSIWPEPFGLTHLESMASGTPVISTTGGGCGEFLVERQNSLTFKASDAEDLARAIRTMCTVPGLPERLAANARQEVEKRFDIERYIDDLAGLCTEAASTGRE